MGIYLYISRPLDKFKSQYCSNFSFQKFSRKYSGEFSNYSFRIALERYQDKKTLYSHWSPQLLQYIQQNHHIGVNGNQKGCAPKVVVEELLSNEDFVLILRWNAKVLIIERHVSTKLRFDVTREHF